MNNIFALVTAILMLTGCSLIGNFEHVSYQVLQADGNIEVRRYDDALIADVSVSGDRNDAANEAFMILLEFIKGNNKSSEPIAMTAPVSQQKEKNGVWKVAFFMPAKFTNENLPAPTDERIKISKIKGGKLAVIKFSGRWTNDNFSEHEQILRDYLKGMKYRSFGEPIYAYYNDPFTPWFLRRNEVMLRLEK